MKLLALLKRGKSKKRRDYNRQQEALLSLVGKEQFKKLTDWGLPISVSL